MTLSELTKKIFSPGNPVTAAVPEGSSEERSTFY